MRRIRVRVGLGPGLECSGWGVRIKVGIELGASARVSLQVIARVRVEPPQRAHIEPEAMNEATRSLVAVSMGLGLASG